METNSSASRRVLAQVQRNPDIGSPRSVGSTSDRRSGSKTGSGTLSFVRPPPGRRTLALERVPGRQLFQSAINRAGRDPRGARNSSDAAIPNQPRLRRREQTPPTLVQLRQKRAKACPNRIEVYHSGSLSRETTVENRPRHPSLNPIQLIFDGP